jgi:hypothetical protein
LDAADAAVLEELKEEFPFREILSVAKFIAPKYYLCCAERLRRWRSVMTPNEFRKMALSLPGTVDSAHMNHPDFRVAGKIFATLGYPNTERGMVKVTPVEQEMLVRGEPLVFSPEAGAWGRQGCTRVNLKAAKKETIRGALAAAWRLAAPESLAQEFPREGAAGSVAKKQDKTAKSSRQKVRRSSKTTKGLRKRG